MRPVVEADYSMQQAAQIVGVGPTALRRWVEAWREREAQMPATVAA
jgi:transposase